VNEGGISVYMAAKEVGIAYTTAKSIISKLDTVKAARKQRASIVKKNIEKKHGEVILQETELQSPQVQQLVDIGERTPFSQALSFYQAPHPPYVGLPYGFPPHLMFHSPFFPRWP
jgi:molybdenum-dependent DNA-binding transcriptional regulator ModE